MKNVLLFIAIAIAAVGGFFALQTANDYIRYMGFHDCAQIASYEETLPEQNVRVTYPLQDVYNQCLADKGITRLGSN